MNENVIVHVSTRDYGGKWLGWYSAPKRGTDKQPRISIHIPRMWRHWQHHSKYRDDHQRAVHYFWLEWLQTEFHEWIHALMDRWSMKGKYSERIVEAMAEKMLIKYLVNKYLYGMRDPFTVHDLYNGTTTTPSPNESKKYAQETE
ncbi:MAG: hypothetical protein ACXADO_00580 [Candidatus Thorarchaeota archaeon]|jgi:hypothetical protein